MAVQYKLTYFDFRGLGELPRLVFHTAGQSFEDDRINAEQLEKIRSDLPFGQVPVLQMNGEYFAQSVAISNYLAREFGLYGKSNVESLKIDQAMQHLQDLKKHIIHAMFVEQDPVVKEKLLKTLKEEIIPKFYRGFEKLLEKNKTGYFVGSQVNLADLAVFDVTNSMSHHGFLTVADFPLVKANVDKVTSHPKLAKYLSERKPL